MKKAMIILGLLTLSACASSLTPPAPVSDPQVLVANANEAEAAARQNLREAVAEQTAPFWALREKYGEPGPECRLFAQLTPEQRRQGIAHSVSAEARLQKAWDTEHAANDERIVAATVVGGGLAGLGAAMNAQDQETVYADLGYELWVAQEGKVDLSRPECGFTHTSEGHGCSVASYHGGENEALCAFIMSDVSLKQFWGRSNEGIMADLKIQDELDQAYKTYIIGGSDNARVEAASSRLSEAEDNEFQTCLNTHEASDTNNCSHTWARQDADEMLGPPELVKRYINNGTAH